MLKFHSLLLLGALVTIPSTSADPVHILSQNLEQTITSSTLQWKITGGNDLKNAVVAAYQTVDDIPNDKIEESSDNDVLKNQQPVYVCRAKVNSIWVTGQLRPKDHLCVVSLYGKVQEYQQSEVLINIDNSARLSWVGKNKYTNLPQGAVTSGENVLRSFVARKSISTNNKSGSLTHYVGTFNPSENLGVYHLVDENNSEIFYEDGEILVETEPVTYEFKNIKFKRAPRRAPKNRVELAHTILKNDASGLQKVESVMDYEYQYFLSWGKGHGILTGLPFAVFLPNGSRVDGRWGLPEPVQKVETVPVDKYLEEGTAVNITLVGNKTELEIPYIATVVAIYKDDERREFIIEDIKRERKVVDVAFDFSPVYFLHNNSHVPTTTTTTTTTTTSTTTTTTKSTSTTQEVTPISPPEVVMRKKQEELHAASKKNDGSVQSDEETSVKAASSLEKKPNSSSNRGYPLVPFSIIHAIIIVFVTLRVT